MESYSILTVDLMNPKVKQYVEMKMKRIQTVAQAKSIAANVEDWAYRVVDQHGNCGVLCFRGVEVALFYKRMVSPITMEEMDPIPEGPGIHPDMLWIRVEFFHTKAAKSRNKAEVKLQETMESELEKYKGLSTQLRIETEQLYKSLEVLEGRLDRAKKLSQTKGSKKPVVVKRPKKVMKKRK